LKLLSSINSKSNEDLTKDFDYIKIINSTFDKYKNNYEYLVNIIILLKICLKNKNYCNEIMEFNLIEKISGQIKVIEYKDDLIYNFSDLLYNAIETNENKEKIFSNEIINHVFDLISKYSQKIDDDKKTETTTENEVDKKININTKIILDENSIKIFNLILSNYLKIINYILLNDIKVDIINENYINIISNTINKKN
jgi:hypothetical protein